MANEARYRRECEVCGVPGYTNMVGGVPQFDPPLTPAQQAIADLVLAAHVEDNDAYCKSTDLRTYAPAVALYAAITPVQWQAYLALQKSYNDYRRNLAIQCACVEGEQNCLELFMRSIETGAPEDRAAWLAKLAAIRAEYAYPSGQA